MKLLNISIDDVSPHPESNFNVLHQAAKVIERFPNVKFTLFVPTAYWRTKTAATDQPLFLRESKEASWVMEHINKDTFEFGYHGYYHGIPGETDNDEFKSLNDLEAFKKFTDMIAAAGPNNKFFKPLFRPPAWRMSPSSFKAAKEFGIKTFALSPDSYALETYASADKDVDVVYYTAAPPFKPLELVEKTEIVYHACTWDKNFLSDKAVEELIAFLEKHEGEYEFAFIEELV